LVYPYLINAIAIPVTDDGDGVRATEVVHHIPIGIPVTIAVIKDPLPEIRIV